MSARSASDATTLSASTRFVAPGQLRQARKRDRIQGVLPKLVLDQVMTSPPTIGALTSATAISGGTGWYPLKAGVLTGTNAAVDSTAPFDYVGVGVASARQNGTSFPGYSYAVFDSPQHPSVQSASYTARFMFDGTTLEICFQNYNQYQWQLYVDGAAVASSATTVTGTPGTAFLPVTFSTRAARLIEFRSSLPWGGVRTAATDTIWRPAPAGGPRCVILGDSYTGGTGADAPGITGWPQKFAARMGILDLIPSGIGGSGYINPGQGVRFLDRVQSDVIALAPDLVIVAGGHNDDPSHGAGYSIGQFAQAVQATLAAIRLGLPNAKIVVVGPMGAQGAQTSYGQMQLAMVSASQGIADLVIDTMNPAVGVVPARPWFFGLGYQGNAQGTGNDDFYIWTDNVHPNQAGHDYIARRVADAIDQSGLLAA